MRKYILKPLAVTAVLIGACSTLVHPYGDMKHRASEAALMNDTTVDTAIIKTVEKACRNCHSERTEWPWYSYVAPMSWMIEGDVYNGRRHMNFSHWADYGTGAKQALLAQIAVMVRNRKMPLARYLVLHPEAKLSDAEIEQIDQWARSERRRLKIMASPASRTPSGASQ